MMRRFFNLQCFTEEGGDGGNGGNGGNGGPNNAGGNGAGGTGGYSFNQAEEIANARAERASKAALSSYFKQQGMSQEEVEAALADFKQKKDLKNPDSKKLQDELEAEKAKNAALLNTQYLSGKNVRKEDIEYVMFKVSQQVDDKTTFEKAADAFLKANPRFTTSGGYRVSTSTESSGGNGVGQQTPNEQINALIRGHFGR